MNDSERILQHAQFGEVRFRKMPRSRSVRISVRSGRGVLVTLPLQESFAVAERFLHEKTQWVADALARMKAAAPPRPTQFTPDTEFATFSRKVQLIPEARRNVRVKIVPQLVCIYYPEQCSVEDEALQATIRQAVEHAWWVEAHEVLPPRVAQLATLTNLPYKELKIKKAVGYWGLCTPDNVITLNIHLMHLPEPLIDYIILHELCHTVHKNHGPQFWAHLNTLTHGNARALSKEMRRYSTRVY
jgi:predicted metal-dependent hydrolase